MPPATAQPRSTAHPCFYAGARNGFGRIHLPVAPSCNIQCAYCRRDYDCPNENRPGATREVLLPEAAVERLERALREMPYISVAAIAGPGDAFSNPETTLKTFELIRRKNRDIALCVSTNGLNVAEYIRQLCALDVRFVTVTVNAIDPNIGRHLYKWVNVGDETIHGIEAARMLLSRQLEALSLLKAARVTVKVNTVVVPGVNEDHALFLAGKMGRLGVDLMNFLPLIPLPGTDMEGLLPPDEQRMHKLRILAGHSVAQMHHCARCRSDAAGFLKTPAVV